MSLIGWLLKPKWLMAKKHTKNVKTGKYTISSHAQNRVADKKRKLLKIDVPVNLFTKPIKITNIRNDEKGPSYQRIGKRATTSINPNNNKVTSVWRTSRKKKGK